MHRVRNPQLDRLEIWLDQGQRIVLVGQGEPPVVSITRDDSRRQLFAAPHFDALWIPAGRAGDQLFFFSDQI